MLWGEAEGSIRRLPLAHEHFQRFRQNPRTLEQVAAVLNAQAFPIAVRDGDEVLSLKLAAVTGNFFRVLGARPLLGRLLTPDDDVKGAPGAMIISRALWHTRFGADPDVIGRRLTLHERDTGYTIVGVAPAGLEFPAGADIWVPVSLFTQTEAVPIARLSPGVTPAAAAAELTESFHRDGPIAWRNVHGMAAPLSHVVVGDTEIGRAAAVRSGGAAGADWVRERRQPAARPHIRTDAGTCGSPRPGGTAGTHRSTAACGSGLDRPGRWRARWRACARLRPRADRLGTARTAASRGDSAREYPGSLGFGRVDRRHSSVRSRAGSSRLSVGNVTTHRW